MDELHNSHNRPEIPRHLPPSDAPPPADTPPIIIGADYDGDAPAPTTPPSERYIDTNFNYETRQGAADTQPPAALGELSIKGAAETAAEAATDESPEEPDTTPTPDVPEHTKADSDAASDMPPPTDIPPTETANTNPNRGVALQRLCDYSAVSDQPVKNALANAERENNGELSENAEFEIISAVVEQELQYANLQYGSHLKDAGLEFSPIGGGAIGLSIVNLNAFSEALSQVQFPENPQAQDHLQEMTAEAIEGAITAINATLILTDLPTAISALGDQVPPTPEFDIILNATGMPALEKVDFALEFAGRADDFASDLTRIGVPQSTVEPLEQLALAAGENFLTEFAVGCRLYLIGVSDQVTGVDRLRAADDWEPVYRFFDHLVAKRPGADFTEDVRTVVVRDIGSALHPDSLELTRTDDIEADVENFVHRCNLLRDAQSDLHYARQRIRHIGPK